MSTPTTRPADTRAEGARIGVSEAGTLATVRRGLALSPELTRGFGITLLLAALATLGKLAVPVAVQQTTDHGLLADGGPDVRYTVTMAGTTLAVVVVLSLASYLVNVRLFTAAESGLATLRTKAFRHIHDLSVLTQSTERRGALVSRVTSDVDTISQFVQFGGIMLILSVGQIIAVTVLMVVYSPWLALTVWVVFLPMMLGIRRLQPFVGRGYTRVRERVGAMLSAISESIGGASTIRAYGSQEVTRKRTTDAVLAHRDAAIRAQWRTVSVFTLGMLSSGLAVAAVVGVGTLLVGRQWVTLGEMVAFVFLVQLFTAPVNQATEILNELQNAVACWRRVIGIIDTPADVADPEPGVDSPRGPATVTLDRVSFAYPRSDRVLHEVDLEFVAGRRHAIVGETGSGKTTVAKLMTRLQDPQEGAVLLDGVDLREISFEALRRRVVLVPQEGFLFDTDLAANLRFAAPGASPGELEEAVDELDLRDWVDSLSHGLATPVGQRGESLSAGERQLVALLRARLADPDLLVLDEATSAVDPGTEVRVQRALERLTRDRTSVAIAHRLSTAENADVVVVMDGGRVEAVGHHRDVLASSTTYQRLHASWAAQREDVT
ncbi:ABC transporter ATP-binding protein [Kytococcus sp. Marseille-QA3725]